MGEGSLRRIAVIAALALLGVGLATGIGLAANAISGDSIGLSARPLRAGDALAPTTTDDEARTAPRRTTPRTTTTERRTTPRTTTTTARTTPRTTTTTDDHGGSSGGSGSDDSGGGDDSGGSGRGRGRGRGGDD